MIRCFYCGTAKNLTFDHVIPKALGGTDDPTNIVPACRGCNARKGKRAGRATACGHYTYLDEERCLVRGCEQCEPPPSSTLLARVHESASLLDAARTARDGSVRDAVNGGLSLRAIAEAAGLSHQTVANICDRVTAESPAAGIGGR